MSKKLNFNSQKEKMTGRLQERKKKAIDFAERTINGLGLNLGLWTEKYHWEVLDRILNNYFDLNYKNKNNPEDKLRFQKLTGSGWVGKISGALNEEEIQLIKRVISQVITLFGKQESGKFREVEENINKLEQETQKEKIKQAEVSQLINKLSPFATRIANSEQIDFPIVIDYFFRKASSAIEKAQSKLSEKKSRTTQSGKSSSTTKNPSTNSQGEKAKISDNKGTDKKGKEKENNDLNNTQKSGNPQGEAKGKADYDKEISEKLNQKSQASEEKITEILQGTGTEDDPEKLTNFLKQIEKESGGNEIKGKNKEKIDALKEKLLTNPETKQTFLTGLAEKLNKILVEVGLKKEELDQATQTELESLNQEENNQEIIKKEEKLVEKISIKGAEKKIKKIIEEAKSTLEKKTTDWLNKINSIKKQIVQFASQSSFNNKVYLQHKSELEQIFEMGSKNPNTLKQPTSFWKKMALPVALSLGAVVVILATIVIVRKRKQVKVK